MKRRLCLAFVWLSSILILSLSSEAPQSSSAQSHDDLTPQESPTGLIEMRTEGSRRISTAQPAQELSAAAYQIEEASAFTASQIAAGERHTCALTSEGVFCWGDNSYGQLGDGTTVRRLQPVQVIGLDRQVTSIAVGGFHTCAITNYNEVWCWGANDRGQLGDGTSVERHSATRVAGLPSESAFRITTGYLHTCAAGSSGWIGCWGDNRYGQLGDGTTAQRLIPVPVLDIATPNMTVSAGRFHTCAIAGSGVKCWGWNAAGQLGDGTRDSRSRPTSVVGLTGQPVDVAAGGSHTCARRSTIAQCCAAQCWGDNSYGQLGDGTTSSSATPRECLLNNAVKALIPAAYHTCARFGSSADGAACWGANSFGQIGDGTVTSRTTPTVIFSYPNGISQITTGSQHTCAVMRSDGRVKCWGDNSYGQLGDGTTIQRTTPVDVTLQCMTPSGLDVCALQPGDILLERTPEYAAIFGIGGTYFTHAALYLGRVADRGGDPADIRPRIAEAQGYAPNVQDQVWETWLSNTHWWSGSSLLDWAVVRPRTTSAAVYGAIAYARDKASQVDVVFDIRASKSDERKYYCSKLVWKAYKDGSPNGPNLEVDLGFGNISFGLWWVTPDDVYYSSPVVQAMPSSPEPSWRRPIFIVWSPAHLTLIDPLGRRTGFDASTGGTVHEIPGVQYYARGAVVAETITAPSVGPGWQTVVTGYGSGAYTVESGYALQGTRRIYVNGTTYSGKVETYPVRGPMYGVYLPAISHATSETSILSGKLVVGSILQQGQEIVYTYVSDSPRWISVRMFGDTDFDPYLTLAAEGGNILKVDDNGAGFSNAAFFSYGLPSAGKFEIAAAGSHRTTGNYRLLLNEGRSAAISDINHDCTVDISDYSIFETCFGSVSDGCIDADFNLDGTVDTVDYEVLRQQIGLTCD